MGKGRISRKGSMAAVNLLLPVLMLFYAIGASADGNVTMESLTIYTTHEWFRIKPTVYFRCQHESNVYLPDVVDKNHDYAFLGQESWQPLTTLYGEKCKRCGLYEEDTVKADDVFYEGELCPKDFTASTPAGRLVLFQAKQFNATLLCPDCGVISSAEVATSPDESDVEEKEDDKGAGLAFLIIVVVLVVLFALGVVAYTKWRQKQRRDQQARFVKMFEDDDELDAEFGLKEDDL